jgi:hypothetical protein
MVVHPCIQIKPVERHTRCTHRDFNEIRPDVALEDGGADTQVGGRLGGPKKPWQKDWQHDQLPNDRGQVVVGDS